VLNPKETNKKKQRAIVESERRANRLEQKMARHKATGINRMESTAPSSTRAADSQHRWIPATDPLAKSLKALERKFNETLRSVGVTGRHDVSSTANGAGEHPRNPPRPFIV
jgi:hypothetical protein